MLLFLLLLLTFIHIKGSIKALILIDGDRHLSERQKNINRILTVLIPFFWSTLTEYALSASSKGSHDPEIKALKKKQKAYFYESWKGVTG